MKLWTLVFVLFLSACEFSDQTQWLEVHGDDDEATVRIGFGMKPRWAMTFYPHVALPPPVDLWLKKDTDE